MLCEICKKKEATVHLTEIVNDKMAKLNICEACAKDKGTEMEEHFGLSDLLAGLADMGSKAEPESLVSLKCSSCGFSYSDFKKVGRLGCGDCYETFKAKLSSLLKRIHGADRHVGKIPLSGTDTIKDTRNLQELKMRMEKAIQSEAFEEAARLRDKIRDIEKERKTPGNNG
jgi:protein arginine kinase activator